MNVRSVAYIDRDEKTLGRIIEHYGIDHQRAKAQEELDELIEAVKSNDAGKVLEEMADVLVMMEQLMLIYDISIDQLEAVATYKVTRQLLRMRNEVQDAEER